MMITRIHLHRHMFIVLSHLTYTMFQLTSAAKFWKTIVMAMKQKSLDLNTKHELTHLFEGSSS